MEKRTTIILILSVLTSILIVAILIFFIFRLLRLYNMRKFEFIKGIEILNLEKEKEILNTRIEVQEETFQIISREIHDNINQQLTLSKLNLNSIQSQDSLQPNGKIDYSIQLISESIKGLTNLSRSLNSDLIRDVGISRTLIEEINRIKSINPINIEYKIDEVVDFVAPDIQLLIFRIAQESIRNSIVHGNATHLKIELIMENSTIIFKIADNGKGFDLEKIKDNKLSQGLKNIEKRVFLVNGDLKINSTKGDGTTICISIPWSNESNTGH